jgi:amidohydrolase
MHACGHDAHMAIALMTCFIMSRLKDQLHGSVKFFFQPAEETVGGAQRMIRAGCMHHPEVDCVLGLHVEPKYDTGNIGIRYGKMYAGSDMFNVDIIGKSAHGAHPEDGVDAIAIAANIINTAQTVVSRSVGATNAAVVTFGLIRGGTVRNQIADTVHMEGILRTLDIETRLAVRNRVGRIVVSTAEAMGGKADFTVMESYGPLINDDAVTRIVEANGAALLGRDHIVLEKEPDLCCEDFSYFALEKPACYFHLGCYDESNGPRVDLHHPRFTIDERCLMIGVRLQCANILSILRGVPDDQGTGESDPSAGS